MATEPRTVIRSENHAVLYSDGTILIKEVRASHPHVFRPYRDPKEPDKVGKYTIVGLMPKTRAYFPAKNLIRDHIDQLIREAKLKGLAAGSKFLRDGDLTAKEEYANMYTINASEQRRPAVRSNMRDPKTKKPMILKPGVDEDSIYAGCWVNLLIRPWYQDNSFGKRVNANLIAVQFVRDDEVFGKGRITDEEVDDTFDEFAEEGDSGYSDELADEDEL